MDIIVDSREKARAISKILKYFNEKSINYEVSKLVVGDYQSLDNPRLIVDRKQNIQEIWGNINSGKEHERFRNELLRAIKLGIKLVILCEHGPDITCMEDVIFFYQEETTRFRWKTVNGRKVREPYQQKPIDGKKLYKSMCTMHERYGVDFVFCQKKDTGKRIIEILSGGEYDQ